MPSVTSIESLEKLGFTRVESEVYVHLVQNSPATGYAIAKAIGRTQGATYKVLASLTDKGAVVVEDGESRICRAIPPAELLEQLERRFIEEKDRATEALQDLQPSPEDDHIYHLKSVPQVIERARGMLASSRETVLVDFTPRCLEVLRPDVEMAIARGARVWLQVYEPTEIEDAMITWSAWAEEVLRRIPIDFLYVCVDGHDQLVAALDLETREVHQANWTTSLYMNWLFGGYVKQNMIGTELEWLLMSGATTDEMIAARRKWKEHMPEFITPGYREVKRRFGLEFVDGEDDPDGGFRE